MRSVLKGFCESNFPIIGREKLDRALNNLKSNPNILSPNGKRTKSGTTVFAIKYEDGVVIAGDRRMADGWYGITSDNEIKVHQISDFSAIACSGYCNVITFLETNMSAVCSAFKERYEHDLSPDGQANFLRGLLEDWWFTFLDYWYWTAGVPLLAAYDVVLEEARIFSFDEDGFYFEPEFAAGTGCGWNSVKNVIADRRREVKNADTAIELAVRAMIHSGISSHGVSDTRISLPQIGHY